MQYSWLLAFNRAFMYEENDYYIHKTGWLSSFLFLFLPHFSIHSPLKAREKCNENGQNQHSNFLQFSNQNWGFFKKTLNNATFTIQISLFYGFYPILHYLISSKFIGKWQRSSAQTRQPSQISPLQTKRFAIHRVLGLWPKRVTSQWSPDALHLR